METVKCNNNSEEKLIESRKNGADYGSKGDMAMESCHSKIPYPKSVFFIITNEFCERFSYYGMKAVLILYLRNVLNYEEDPATVVYHVFSMFCYFTPLLGAMIADSVLGKFKTIFYLSIVYAFGNIALSLSSIKDLGLPQKTFALIGLGLIAAGTGGIKPCVSAFGGDQFTLPQQAVQLASFFSIFYFSINAGSLLSTCITPYFRKGIPCLGEDTCYPLAFGVPAVLMIVSLVVFVVGKPWYTCRKPDGNIMMRVASCISHAISRRFKSSEKKEHWLDHAADKYDNELISSIKTLLRILVLYLPLPLFWALFDQQGSRWTFQATRMNGNVFGFTILPDQMQVINPALILIFIPIFDQLIYPGLAKIGLLKKPLQRLTLGGLLAGLAFAISGFLELKLETTYAVKLTGQESHLNFVNNLPCAVQMKLGEYDVEINSYEQYIIPRIEAGKDFVAHFTPKGEACSAYQPWDYTVKTVKQTARSYIIVGNNVTASVKNVEKADHLEKDGDGSSLIKLALVGFDENVKGNIEVRFPGKPIPVKIWKIVESEADSKENAKPVGALAIPYTALDTDIYKLDAGEYNIVLVTDAVETKNISKQEILLGTIQPKQGGNYLYVINKGSNKLVESVITNPNSVHMLWLVPQYVIITLGEVMFSVTGLTFSFAQAPASMKSVVQACWLLTVAFGNVIVVFIAEFKFVEKQSSEFFLYTILMVIDMVIFAVLAYFYIPIEETFNKKNDDAPSSVEMKERSEP